MLVFRGVSWISMVRNWIISLLGTVPYPLPAGTFESMMFRMMKPQHLPPKFHWNLCWYIQGTDVYQRAWRLPKPRTFSKAPKMWVQKYLISPYLLWKSGFPTNLPKQAVNNKQWKQQSTTSWWFETFFIFYPDPWGNDPFWRAYFSTGLVQPAPRNSPTKHQKTGRVSEVKNPRGFIEEASLRVVSTHRTGTHPFCNLYQQAILAGIPSIIGYCRGIALGVCDIGVCCNFSWSVAFWLVEFFSDSWVSTWTFCFNKKWFWI